MNIFLPKLFQTLNTYGWMVWFFPTNNTYIRVWNTTSPGREARIILCPISMQTPKNHFFDCGQTRTIVVEYYHVRNIFNLQNSIWFPSKLLLCCRYYIFCCRHEFNFTMFDFPSDKQIAMHCCGNWMFAWLFYSLYAFKDLDTFHRIQTYFNFSFQNDRHFLFVGLYDLKSHNNIFLRMIYRNLISYI